MGINAALQDTGVAGIRYMPTPRTICSLREKKGGGARHFIQAAVDHDLRIWKKQPEKAKVVTESGGKKHAFVKTN